MRPTYVIALLAENLQVKKRESCPRPGLCSSGPRVFRVVCAVEFTDLIILVITWAPEGNVVSAAESLGQHGVGCHGPSRSLCHDHMQLSWRQQWLTTSSEGLCSVGESGLTLLKSPGRF